MECKECYSDKNRITPLLGNNVSSPIFLNMKDLISILLILMNKRFLEQKTVCLQIIMLYVTETVR